MQFTIQIEREDVALGTPLSYDVGGEVVDFVLDVKDVLNTGLTCLYERGEPMPRMGDVLALRTETGEIGRVRMDFDGLTTVS